VIYAFSCQKCGESFDMRATVAEMERGLEPKCPRCGSGDATQDYSNVGMMFRSDGRGGPPMCGPGSGGGCC
jgi:putative FmdB family regulatory protein